MHYPVEYAPQRWILILALDPQSAITVVVETHDPAVYSQ